MQRWIALAAVVFALLLGGGWFGFQTYRDYKNNRPHPIWVPLAINPSASREQQLQTVATLEKTFRDEAVLQQICNDISLARDWELPNNDACAKELGQIIFVKTGSMDTPQGSIPAILVGVRGKVKHKAVSEKICLRMLQDVSKALGLPPPPQGSQGEGPMFR